MLFILIILFIRIHPTDVKLSLKNINYFIKLFSMVNTLWQILDILRKYILMLLILLLVSSLIHILKYNNLYSIIPMYNIIKRKKKTTLRYGCWQQLDSLTNPDTSFHLMVLLCDYILCLCQKASNCIILTQAHPQKSMIEKLKI